VQKDMNEAIAKATADHELKMRQLQDRVDAMDRQVHEIVERNKEEEQRLRREKSRLESTLNSKIAQYDEDMESRQKTLIELQQQFAEESLKYAKLKEHFDQIDADIGRMNEEDLLLLAVKRREEFGLQIIFRAAANIQKIFRGRQARKIFTAMKAKSKKGKKKGKPKK
jgi:beta-glucosidase-like glycosyl hydrolase